MSITFNQPEPDPKPSLAYRLGLIGNVRFLQQHGFWISAEDNDEEYVQVRVCVA